MHSRSPRGKVYLRGSSRWWYVNWPTNFKVRMRARKKSLEVTSSLSRLKIPLCSAPGWFSSSSSQQQNQRPTRSSFIAMFPFCVESVASFEEGGERELRASERAAQKMAEMAFMVSYVTWMDARPPPIQAFAHFGPWKPAPQLWPDLPACNGTML